LRRKLFRKFHSRDYRISHQNINDKTAPAKIGVEFDGQIKVSNLRQTQNGKLGQMFWTKFWKRDQQI